MKNFFNSQDTLELINRIETLKPDSQRQWGKMDVAQMLAHCTIGIKTANGSLKPKRAFIGYLIGRMYKKKFFDRDEPLDKNSPTGKDFLIADPKDFNTEKQHLLNAIRGFATAGPEGVTNHPHGFFGHLTPQEWSDGQYKHIHHHLTQFGV